LTFRILQASSRVRPEEAKVLRVAALPLEAEEAV
jgi:hypothetical protein